MMNRKVRKEWKQYVFEKGENYTFDEAINKAKAAFLFLKSKGVRIDKSMVLNLEKFETDFHLSEMEKEKYIQIFNQSGYATHDCVTIVKVMDAIYHMFDITKEKAFEMAEYAAENRLTITQTVKDKLEVDFNELVEFEETVLPEITKYFLDKTLKSGKELLEAIKDAFDSKELQKELNEENNYIVDQEELCQYIKDQLGEESKLTLEDIDTVLNLEMDFLKSKGIVD